MVGPQGASILALEFQLERSQWFDPESIVSRQLAQLKALLEHAFRHVPYYRKLLAEAGLRRTRNFSMEDWRTIPILTRQRLQEAGDTLNAARIPDRHGTVHVMRSSGSTGMPVSIRRTNLCSLIYQAITLRDHIWHERDPAGKLAVIRHSPGTPPSGHRSANWGRSTSQLYGTGTAVRFHSARDIGEQAEWLARENPDYLLTYPSIVDALARRSLDGGLALPALREVRTFGEALGPDVRRLCEEAWQVPLTDGYSAQEIGYMALQCPGRAHYHVQSECVLLEVVDANGRPCAPGATGRVLATPLHNYATPLLRYEIGDYAEVGAPCECGRGLPVLARVLGRRRNLVKLPDGRMYRPAVGMNAYRDVAPVIQAQLVQHSLDTVEARLVVEAPLTRRQEEQLTGRIRDSLGHPFNIVLAYVDRIERSGRDKFEDFLCKV